MLSCESSRALFYRARRVTASRRAFLSREIDMNRLFSLFFTWTYPATCRKKKSTSVFTKTIQSEADDGRTAKKKEPLYGNPLRTGTIEATCLPSASPVPTVYGGLAYERGDKIERQVFFFYSAHRQKRSWRGRGMSTECRKTQRDRGPRKDTRAR